MSLPNVPKFQFSILEDENGIYKSFPEPNGRTLIARQYPDWHLIPDRASIIVETDDKKVFTGTFVRNELRDNGFFHLVQEVGRAKEIFAEHVVEVWEPKAYISGEVQMVQPQAVAA